MNFFFLKNKMICFEDNFALLLALLFVQNNESAAMFVYKKNPVGIELFSRVQTLFYSKRFAKLLTTWLKTIYNLFYSYSGKQGWSWPCFDTNRPALLSK